MVERNRGPGAAPGGTEPEREPTARVLDDDGRPVPRQASMGLLNYITATSLDEDYAHVSEQGRGADDAGPAASRRATRTATVAVLVGFGLLVTTAGIQTARNEPIRESSRESLVAQVQDRRAELEETRRRVGVLRAEVEQARSRALDASQAGRSVQNQLERLGVATGLDAATGPGIRIAVDDSPAATTDRQVVLDTDLQLLVNGLWVSGAEAVSINGQRITNLTSIRVAGEAITVNLRSLSAPYVVAAIGDPDQLAARFVESDAGAWWLNLKAVYGLQFELTTRSSEEPLTVPAAPPLTLRHARRLGADR